MTIPKTLKDFDFNNYGSGNPDWSDGPAIEKDLREEAIKWIKEEYVPIATTEYGEISNEGNFWLKQWIMYFFDIKPEELIRRVKNETISRYS